MLTHYWFHRVLLGWWGNVTKKVKKLPDQPPTFRVQLPTGKPCRHFPTQVDQQWNKSAAPRTTTTLSVPSQSIWHLDSPCRSELNAEFPPHPCLLYRPPFSRRPKFAASV